MSTATESTPKKEETDTERRGKLYDCLTKICKEWQYGAYDVHIRRAITPMYVGTPRILFESTRPHALMQLLFTFDAGARAERDECRAVWAPNTLVYEAKGLTIRTWEDIAKHAQAATAAVDKQVPCTRQNVEPAIETLFKGFLTHPFKVAKSDFSDADADDHSESLVMVVPQGYIKMVWQDKKLKPHACKLDIVSHGGPSYSWGTSSITDLLWAIEAKGIHNGYLI